MAQAIDRLLGYSITGGMTVEEVKAKGWIVDQVTEQSIAYHTWALKDPNDLTSLERVSGIVMNASSVTGNINLSPMWTNYVETGKSYMGYAKTGLTGLSAALTGSKFGRSVGYFEGVTLSEMRMQRQLTKKALGGAAKGLGVGAWIAGAVGDGIGVYQYGANGPTAPGAVSPTAAIMNTGMGALGLFGGPVGMTLSIMWQVGQMPIFQTPLGSFSRPLPIAPSDATSVYPSGSQGAYQSWYDYYIKR